MERITISLEPELAEQFDSFIKKQGYTNRSEAMRDLIRKRLEHDKLQESDDGHCYATLSYIYNHHEMDLAGRVTKLHHKHHELNLASVHVHLDHDYCLEVAIIRGAITEVRKFSNALIAERGVRHGKLSMIPVAVEETRHSKDGRSHHHSRPVT